MFSEVPSSTEIHLRLMSRCSAGYSDPCSTCSTSSELNSIVLAMAWPCAGPRSSVRRISRSSVPCNSSMRSRSSLVDILGENRAFLVECQGEDTVYTRSEEHTSELQSLTNLVCRLLLEKKKSTTRTQSLRLITSLDS